MDTFRDILQLVSTFLLPLVIVGIPAYGLLRRVPVYESFVTGAKEGFGTAIMILPYLVAILFAFAMFRASGALDAMTGFLGSSLLAIGFPPECLPMALLRPLSGSGSLAVLSDSVSRYGVESEIVAINATIFGSSETTLYVLAVYFGSVGIKRIRHALATGLIADFTAVVFAVIFVRLLVS